MKKASKLILRAGDGLLCALIFIAGGVLIAFSGMTWRLLRWACRKPHHGKRNLLSLAASATLEALERKFGHERMVQLIAERDLNGYFDLSYTIHFSAPKTQKCVIGGHYPVYEISLRFHPLHRLGLHGLHSLWNAFHFLWQAMRIVFQEDISAIRAYDPFLHGLVGIVLDRITGRPCVVSIHSDYDEIGQTTGLAENWRYGPVGRAMQRVVLSQARLVLPISEHLARWAKRHGAPVERIRVIPHGIDLEPYRNYCPHGVKESLDISGRSMLISISRLSPEKYVDDMIYALGKVIATRPSLQGHLFLVVAGDGPEREKLEALASQLGLGSSVLFLGYVPYHQVVSLWCEADINLCLNGGFSLIEAAASAVPTIAYDNEWHGELIRNGESGFLVPFRDQDAVANAVLYLLEHPEVGKRLGARAKELAFDNYSLERAQKIKIGIFEELFTSHGSQQRE